MAAKKRPHNTRWRATTYERTYRGRFVWVEQCFRSEPKWQWQCMDVYPGGEGRARTMRAAMRAAERAVDAALKGGHST